MFPIPHPKMILMENAACCALRTAYGNCEEQFLEAMGNMMSPRLVKIFGEIFTRTARLGFIPNNSQRIFYSKLAAEEIKRLEKSGIARLLCGHSREQHLLALKTVLANMEYWQN